MLTGGKADPDLQKQIKDGGYKKKKKEEDNNVKSGLRPHSFSDTPKSDKMPINAKKKKITKYEIENGTLMRKQSLCIKEDMVMNG